MEAPTVVAIIFGGLGVFGVCLGFVWTHATNMGKLTSGVKVIGQKTDEMHTLLKESTGEIRQLVTDHATTCDKERAEMTVQHKAVGNTLDDVKKRLRGLEARGEA